MNTSILLSFGNETSLPITVLSKYETNWWQFGITAFLGSAIILLYLIPIAVSSFSNAKIWWQLRTYKKQTGRRVMMINHSSQGLFFSGMITQSTIQKVARALDKFKGAPFDLILHTPGGEVFSSLMISRMFNKYPNEIRAIVPYYAMSGGTLLALSCDKICMSETASLGPIDPQLGSFFKVGSARGWKEVLRKKGNKVEDQSILFNMAGQQYTQTIKEHITEVMQVPCKKKKEFISYISSGDVEHAKALTADDLRKFGFDITTIGDRLQSLLIKLVGRTDKEVFYV